jgi:hypothetical protein
MIAISKGKRKAGNLIEVLTSLKRAIHDGG